MDQFEELDNILSSYGLESLSLQPVENLSRDPESDDDVEWGQEDEEEVPGARATLLIEQFLANTDECEDEVADTEGPGDLQTNCQCKNPCLQTFDHKDIEEHVLNLQEIDKDSKELYIMGSLQKFSHDGTRAGKRKRIRYKFAYEDKTICKAAFCTVFDIKPKTLSALQKHLELNGPVPRVHGNSGRKPYNALKYEDVKFCVNFLLRFAETNGIPQPSAPRGRDEDPPVFLESTLTKKEVHSRFNVDAIDAGVRKLCLSTFKGIWSHCLPHIRICGPRQDVCHKCEIMRKKVADAVAEATKLEAATALTDHIESAQRERERYRETVQAAIQEMEGHQPGPRPIPALSCPDLSQSHYTFDYSQNVTLPHHSRQMGPLYFVTGRKIQIFGVRVDGTGQQFNYLIDEDQSIGPDGTRTHGPDSVISMLHNSLQQQGFGERRCVLHADNAGGQNKNRYLLAYLSWRIRLGLHEEILLLMQIPGHTRCLVDSGFAHLKKLFRRSDVDCLRQLAHVVEKSAKSNFPVLYENPDGSENWLWYDWKGFLQPSHLPIKGIQRYQLPIHHHRSGGCICCKAFR